MVVEARARDLILEGLPQGSEIRAGFLVQLDDDEARDRQVVEIEAGAEPGLEQALGFLPGEGLGALDPLGLPGQRRRALHIGLDGSLGVGPDLDGHLPGDVRSPLGRARGDELRAAGAERGEEGQNGDDGRERLAAGGIDGHQRGIAPERGRQRTLGRGCRRRRGFPARPDAFFERAVHSSICSRPSPSTRRRTSSWSMRLKSWVAITTEVPSRLSSMKRRSSRLASDGSTLPVGSSARSRSGRTMSARAMAARCFSPPGENRRQDVHAVAEAHPAQQFHHLGPIARLVLALHAQGQGHVLVGGEMVEEAEILEHHAHPAAQAGQVVLGNIRHVLAEDGDEPPRRAHRHQDQAQERGLAGARRPGEELERIGLDREGEVAQDLRAHAVAHAHILELHDRVRRRCPRCRNTLSRGARHPLWLV